VKHQWSQAKFLRSVDEYRFAGHDGVELAWHEIGSGRPLVLLPGFGGTSSCMLGHGPAGTLAPHGHHIVVPDFRGYGGSA
jgi:pimeloyl-ACP methyl ester carboxylesterase